jgi:hypothetical protein
MYRRAKFVEILLEIRQEMAHEADYDVELFAELARSGRSPVGVRRKMTDPSPVRPAVPEADPLRLDKDTVA